jgi:hypothetical protein
MRTPDRYYGSPGKPLTKVFLQLTEPQAISRVDLIAFTNSAGTLRASNSALRTAFSIGK